MRHKVNYTYIFLLFILISPAALFAQKEIVFSGYGAAGYKVFDRNKLRENNQEAYYEGKLQADIKINKAIDAQLDIRGSSEDETIILREFSVKFNYLKYMRFRLGNIKKPFGLEQQVNTEELLTVERSYIQRTIQDFGYGGRGVSLQAYYNYSKKRPEFPFSYAIALSKDNSLRSSLSGRFSLHEDDLAYSVSYLYLHTGGQYPIGASGFGLDIAYEKNSFTSSFEAVYVKDPAESLRLKLSGSNRSAYSTGLKLLGAYAFNTEGDVVKTVEPVMLLSLFLPESSDKNVHTFEIIAGGNVYLDKDLRLRLNGDILLSRNKFTSSYSTVDSRLIVECQVRF